MKNILIIVLSCLATWIIVQTGFWAKEKYQNLKNPIESGREMFIIRNEENPFEKHDTIFVKILEVKDGYVLYEQKTSRWKDTTSARIGYLRYFTPLNKK